MSVQLRDSRWDGNQIIEKILSKITLPNMALVEQQFDDTKVENISQAVQDQFHKPWINDRIRPGVKIAVTAGSRGIANIDTIIKAVIENLRALKAEPFIVPAMGSHGGATAEGQRAVLQGMGISEDRIGAPIISSMEVVQVGTTSAAKPVFMDKAAFEADGIVVAGRVKPHTAFRGDYESGLAKMMAIGLGNQVGAEFCHNEGFGRMAANVPELAGIMIQNAPILMGLAIVENAFDETFLIESVPAQEILGREPDLLLKAKALMPQIQFPEFDILIIDTIGKNFSGDGMDPNITASYCTPYAHGGPVVQKYVVLDMSEETHGNGVGLGMAHFSTKRVFDKFDFDAAYVNVLTSRATHIAHIPLILKNDKLAISAAVYTAMDIDKDHPRIVRISNTSHIDRIHISEALRAEAETNPKIRILEEFKPFSFDAEGSLLPP